MSSGFIRPATRASKRRNRKRVDPFSIGTVVLVTRSSLDAPSATAERRKTSNVQRLFIEHLTRDFSDPIQGVTGRGKSLPQIWDFRAATRSGGCACRCTSIHGGEFIGPCEKNICIVPHSRQRKWIESRRAHGLGASQTGQRVSFCGNRRWQ